MAAEISLDDSAHGRSMNESVTADANQSSVIMEDNYPTATTTTFPTACPSDITANLHPHQLPIARVQRAWERRPAQSLLRKGVVGGRVWKRVGVPSRRTGLGRTAQGSWAHVLSPGAAKPVKKVCVGSGEGALRGSVVARWEGRDWENGSPVRKIVTRSSLQGASAETDELLLALPEEEDEACAELRSSAPGSQEGNVTVETLDENGRILDISHGAQDEDASEWSDVEDEEEERGATVNHEPTGIISATSSVTSLEEPRSDDDATTQELAGAPQQVKTDPPFGDVEVAEETVHEHIQPTALETASPSQTTPVRPKYPVPAPALPEGFVTPVQRRRRQLGGRAKLAAQAAASLSNDRRRTLPTGFASEENVGSNFQVRQESSSTTGKHDVVESETTLVVIDTCAAECYDVNADADGDFREFEQDDESTEKLNSPELAAEGATQTHTNSTQSEETFHHPPYRSSSRRRRSASPLKQRDAFVAAEGRRVEHLLAFTPVKQRPTYLTRTPPKSDDLNSSVSSAGEETMAQDASPTTTTATTNSPPRPARARVSDGTTFLQAFLDRAAESKISRAHSTSSTSNTTTRTAERESLTNRRDSDAVRHALADPEPDVKSEDVVLTELDPNTPASSRISSSETSKSIGERCQTGSDATDSTTEDPTITGDGVDSPDQHNLEMETANDATSTKPTNRRSSRTGRRKPQTFAPGTPARITIRGPTSASAANGSLETLLAGDGKSEAQILAAQTKANTKKNKGGSVLPLLRLVGLVKELELGDVEYAGGETDVSNKGRKGNVRWAETLASYSGAKHELNADGDAQIEQMEGGAEAARSEESFADIDAVNDSVAQPPPPAETPSKPRSKAKIRRLKTPRKTASNDAISTEVVSHVNVTQADTVLASSDDPQPQIPAAPTRTKSASGMASRRSRIATPAKGLAATTHSLQAPPPSMDIVGDTKPKIKSLPTVSGVSKLPAPSSTSSSISLPSGRTDKENLPGMLTASPARKRPKKAQASSVAGSGPVKTFAPKLEFGLNGAEVLPPSFAPSIVPSVKEPNSAAASSGLPGFSSPAKKAGRRAVGVSGISFGNGLGGAGKMESEPGLASPAKKRTRRGA